MLWTLMIPGWMPTPLNQLMGHFGKRSRLKKQDRNAVHLALLAYQVPRALGKRRVTTHVILPPKQRAPDPDALFKSLLDALVWHGALKDDNKEWLQLDPPQFCRGPELITFITLQEIV